VNDDLAAAGRLGPVARLMPTTAAKTLRKGRETVVLDGPFAETKEQLLGFFVVECADMTEALATAKQLAVANRDALGAYEVRPIDFWRPGGEIAPR
jgi:hypothetical protein